jgi:hypothetical protein
MDLPEVNSELAYTSKDVKINDWYSKLSSGILYTALNKYEPRNRYDESIIFNFSQYASIEKSISKYDFERDYYSKMQNINLFEELKWVDGLTCPPSSSNLNCEIRS